MFEGYSSRSNSKPEDDARPWSQAERRSDIQSKQAGAEPRAGGIVYRKMRLAERSAEAIAVFTSSCPVQ